MDHELQALLVIVGITLSAIIIDVYLARRYGTENTISDWIRVWFRQRWYGTWVIVALCLAAGCLLGHFFLCPSCDGAEPTITMPDGVPPKPAEIILGQRIFLDPIFSANGTISCETCHNDANGGGDGQRLSIGINGQVGIRNGPTVFDAIFPAKGEKEPREFHDGRTVGLATQSLQPIINPVEMGNQREEDVLAKALQKYGDEFRELYGETVVKTSLVPVTQTINRGLRGRRTQTVNLAPRSVTHVSREAWGRVLTAFESTLVSPHDAPYDRYMAGDLEAMTTKQVVGMGLFFSSNCVACHVPPLFQDRKPHNNGMAFASAGAQQIGVTPNGARRELMTANLRLACDTAPYAFDGSFPTIRRCLEHYNAGGAVVIGGVVQADPLIDRTIQPLRIPEEGLQALEDFIANGLRSKSRPKISIASTNGTP